mmetsp:Transcript_182517/g.578372  ORF Transcript_182517/g.578372 Transcript_182517/m.578372 type:complete len:108 (-) Transcript_182517:70-393(-)
MQCGDCCLLQDWSGAQPDDSPPTLACGLFFVAIANRAANGREALTLLWHQCSRQRAQQAEPALFALATGSIPRTMEWSWFCDKEAGPPRSRCRKHGFYFASLVRHMC